MSDEPVTILIENSVVHGDVVSGDKIVNHAPVARTLLGRSIPTDIVRRLRERPVASLVVEAYNPDAETSQFAFHFYELAIGLGWSLKSRPNRTDCPDLVFGIHIQSMVPTEAADDPLEALRDWLSAQGLSAEYRRGSATNTIRVGPRPP